MSPDFSRNNEEMLSAAARCIDLREHMPALVLIYSHIDTLAWAGSDKHGDVRSRFEAWVTRWLLPELSQDAPSLTATDVYAARCGVLHTLTSKSKLSRSGAARQIGYAWGTASAARLSAALEASPVRGQLVILQFERLLEALRNAVDAFVKATETDAVLRGRLSAAAAEHYTVIPPRPSTS